MHFSRIEPMHDAFDVKGIVQMSAGDGYFIHKTVWKLFGDGPNRKRDFLYRVDEARSWPVIYSVSQREPVHLGGGWRIETKPYHPKLMAGDKLDFSLRVNAVRSRRDAESRQHRYDIVQDARARAKLQGEKSSTPIAVLAWTEGTAWLGERAAKHGFSVNPDQVRIGGYRRHVFEKKGKKVTINTLDLCGLLTVTDPDAFRQTLFAGMGPAKGFGCGMMMVKRLR